MRRTLLKPYAVGFVVAATLGALTLAAAVWWHSTTRLREGIVVATSARNTACPLPGAPKNVSMPEPEFTVTIRSTGERLHTFRVPRDVYSSLLPNYRVRWNRKGVVQP